MWRSLINRINEELNLFTQDLQKFDEHLKFDITDAGHSANFLDVTIKLVPDDMQDDFLTPVFSVYRKPQYTGVSIHQRSLHPPSQKLSIVHSAVTRLLRLPLSRDAYDTEIATIEQIVRLNDLKRSMSPNLLNVGDSVNSSPTISYTNSYPTPPLPPPLLASGSVFLIWVGPPML